MNKADKIYEAKVQLDNRKRYERLKAPMVKTTQEKVNDLINRLHQIEKHIDDMTRQSRTTCSYFCRRGIKNRNGLACNPDKMEVNHLCSCFHSITLPGIH